MSHQTIRQGVVPGIVGVLLALAATDAARAAVVETGWDLFETVQPTTFAGESWEGVPLGTFDFGGAIGVQDTGTTDTIVERLDVASVDFPPGPSVVVIELVALQLKSIDQIDLGGGLDFYFITLDVDSPSSGEMTIMFDDADGGTFDSSINVDFDIRIGALDGLIIFSDVLQLSADDVPWDRIAPPGALTIPGVNHLLNGFDNAADFWPDLFTEVHPDGAQHSVMPAIPEPSALALLAFGGLTLARRRRPAR